MIRVSLVLGLVAGGAASVAVAQPVIYASGQLLTPGDPGIPPGQPGQDDTRENFVYEIDVTTGVATAVSPMTSGSPAALAGTASGDLFGFSNGQLVDVNPFTASQTNIGDNNGLSSTAFDITADGRGFVLPFNANFDTQQVSNIDLATGEATALGSATAIGDAIDTARGTALGTALPFVISLGSVGDTLYGIDLDTDSLISINSVTGEAAVVGDVGAVGAANGGAYSGFSALTGVDEDLDGDFDALYGSVNFFDDDGDPNTLSQRLGGIGRFDLVTGEWSLVGTNAGVIFFGFGSSPIPTPGATAVLALGGVVASRRRRG
ncbi:MAG: PEP-CTERM sorting domain-containing protein [Planctomycetota bacterium]